MFKNGNTELVITNNAEDIISEYKEFAETNHLEFFTFGNKREDFNKIKELRKANIKCICFIIDIGKSLVYDALLKLMEGCGDSFYIVATNLSIDINEALKQRFLNITYKNKAVDLQKSIDDFMKGKNIKKQMHLTKNSTGTIDEYEFYCGLAKRLVDDNNKNTLYNVQIVNDCINSITKTNNILHESVFDTLNKTIKRG